MSAWHDHIPFHPERPERGADAALVAQIMDWAHRQLGQPGLHCAAVFGPRGQGKTSILLHVAQEALKDTRFARAGRRAPSGELDYEIPIFEPANLDPSDELFADLMAHLEPFAGKDAEKQALATLGAWSRRFKRQDYLDLASEEAATDQRLQDRLAAELRRLGTLGREVRKSFHKLLTSIAPRGDNQPQALLLLVDDLDLQPGRTGELFNLLTTVLDQPPVPVLVLVAADLDLLTDALSAEQRKRFSSERGETPDLAWWMVQKFFATRFELAPWSPAKALKDLLWKESEEANSLLAGLWPEHTEPTAKVEEEEQERRVGFGPAEQARRAEPPRPASRRDWALQALGPFLPTTPRGLKRLHNRLKVLAQGSRPKREDAQAELTNDFAWQLGMAPHQALALVIATFALDERHPFLGLGQLLRQRPDQLVGALRHLLEKKGEPDESLAERLRSPYPAGRHRVGAMLALKELAQFWGQYRSGTDDAPATPPRLLAISLNADALEQSRKLWEGRISQDRIWHIDLRLEGQPIRLPPTELLGVWKRLAEAIEKDKIADQQVPIELVSRAHNSLACWLGWRLHRIRSIQAYNFFSGDLWQGPYEVLRPQSGGLRQDIVVDEHTPTAPNNFENQAVLVLDLLDKGGDALEQFPEPIHQLPHRFRVRRRAGSRSLAPDDLVPLLQEILDLIGELRDERSVHTFHLAIIGPDVVAFFLGQQLHELGRFVLWEHASDQRNYHIALDLTDPR